MRWHSPDKPAPAWYSTRERRLFALLPVRLNEETRWLEWVTVVEQCVHLNECGLTWKRLRFADQPALETEQTAQQGHIRMPAGKVYV